MDNNVRTQQPAGNPSKVLVFGILGLAFGLSTGILGLIFSIIGLNMANSYIATYGDISNQVRIGKRLSIAGLIISICILIVWVVCIIVFVIAAANDPQGLESALSKAISDTASASRIS